MDSTAGDVPVDMQNEMLEVRPALPALYKEAAKRDHRVVWRRHRGTLDATRVAALHAGSSLVLAYDLREKSSELEG